VYFVNGQGAQKSRGQHWYPHRLGACALKAAGKGPYPGWCEAARWWSLLGHGEGELVDVSTLSGGASGSAVYQLLVDLADDAGRGDFVLKVASGQASGEQTRRELNFYRDLAPRVPVLVPKLVAGVEHRDGICLLLESAGAGTSPARWSHDRWEELATELGSLHHKRVAAAATRWPSAKVGPPAAQAEIASAARTWAALGYGPLLTKVWSRFDRLDATLTQLPVCLRHGDWHLGNILLDPVDRFVWIDWQEVGLGHGPEDLALLWQRAEFDGFTPPRDAMLTAYARARGIPDDAILHRAAVAAELTLLLLSWPPYLTSAPEPARARLHGRLEHLADAWQQ
jgi:Ser/Thr protein kinase RdoA (MazF antagonist)